MTSSKQGTSTKLGKLPSLGDTVQATKARKYVAVVPVNYFTCVLPPIGEAIHRPGRHLVEDGTGGLIRDRDRDVRVLPYGSIGLINTESTTRVMIISKYLI